MFLSIPSYCGPSGQGHGPTLVILSITLSMLETERFQPPWKPFAAAEVGAGRGHGLTALLIFLNHSLRPWGEVPSVSETNKLGPGKRDLASDR